MTVPEFDAAAWRNGMRRSVEKMRVRRGLMDYLIARTNEICDAYDIPVLGGIAGTKADGDSVGQA